MVQVELLSHKLTVQYTWNDQELSVVVDDRSQVLSQN